MKIPTLASFKKARKALGTIGSSYWFLTQCDVCEDCIEHYIDGIATDLGVRQLEKMKSNDLYQMHDGFLLAYQEHHIEIPT
jgi:hypothetical protein